MIFFVLFIGLSLCMTITEIEIVTIYFKPTTTALSLTTETSIPNHPNSEIFNYQGAYELNTTFAEIMLKGHNDKRSMHQAQKLAWNNTLFDYASKFTDKYDCSGVLKHSGGIYGENLALGYTPNGAISAWYNEIHDYDFNTHNQYNHFTALIWNSTSQLGCAYKYCNPTWSDYIVCSYYPAGNVVGRSQQNVFRSE